MGGTGIQGFPRHVLESLLNIMFGNYLTPVGQVRLSIGP
jgi:hypothetical protein